MQASSWLMKYEKQGRISSFDMHDGEKATLRLPSGRSFVIFIFEDSDYIVGEAVVTEAADFCAEYIICDSWRALGQSAAREANRLGIEIYNIEEFGRKLDELNAGT